MVDRRALRQLSEIASLLRDRDLAKLAEHQSELNKTKAKHARFIQASENENKLMAKNLGYRREIEGPRLLWREQQIYALSHYAARAAALVEAQKKVAAKSFGRAKVIERIEEASKDSTRR